MLVRTSKVQWDKSMEHSIRDTWLVLYHAIRKKANSHKTNNAQEGLKTFHLPLLQRYQ